MTIRLTDGVGMSRIFLSHSATDSFEAIALKDWLAAEGWDDVFLDLDPKRGIAAGERWERALHAAANRCAAVIFLVSTNWLASRWCLKEYALARGLNKKLFAALIDPTTTLDSLPDELKGVWQVVNLTGGQDHRRFPARLPGSHEERDIFYSDTGILLLKRGLEKAGLDPEFFAWPPASNPGRVPYRGLKPLEAEDAGIFFGRDAPIVEAIDRLRRLRAGAPPRLFVVLGASGAGKSSFLRAGLLPRLARDDLQFIPLPAVRPERAALNGENGLVNALAAVLSPHARAEVRAAVQSGAAALRPLLRERVAAALAQRVAGDESERPPAFVIAVDQAEELFRAEGREESEALLALLVELAGGDDPAVIVISAIRSDSFDVLQNAKGFEGLRLLSLSPMPRGAYLEVIEGPARRVQDSGGKLKIEPALTQRLLMDIDVGMGDALPLLAFALERLYLDYYNTGALRLKDYEQSGGLKGAIDAAVKRALAAADAEKIISTDPAARLTLLRRGLIPWLAGIDPDTGVPRRRVARFSEIPEESRPLINLLVDQRLLTTDVVGGEVTVEPAHEALLRQWDELQEWLKQDFTALKALESVKRAARDWETRQLGHLLWSEERIIDFVRQFESSGLRYDVDESDPIRRFLGPTDLADLEKLLSLSGGHNNELEKTSVSYGKTWSPPLSHKARGSVGVRLALLGHPKAGDGRRGTGLGMDGRPDIDWCKIECNDDVVINILSDTDEPDSEIRETLTQQVRTFFISKYPVTIAQFNGFVDECNKGGKFDAQHFMPSSFPLMLEPPDHEGHYSNEPAFSISWYDAVAFCNWMTARSGHKVRLPTEFEWQLAATGRNQPRIYPWAEVESQRWDPEGETWRANTKESGLMGATAVGLYPEGASPFGVLDMAGTVWEWCQNTFESPNLQDFDQPEVNRVWRGGSWYYEASYARSTYRYWNYPGARNYDVGFRIVSESMA